MEEGSGRIRVLVVDDTDHVREMVVTILEIDDFDVVGQASDGEAAVEAATRLDPDVVVIDYMMPVLDGIETSRKIRAIRPDQTIIMYSAFVDATVAARAAEVGVSLCGKTDGLGALEHEIVRLCKGAGAAGHLDTRA